MSVKFVLRRDDGMYFREIAADGGCSVNVSVYNAKQFTHVGAMSTKNYLNDAQKWRVLPIEISVKEDE